MNMCFYCTVPSSGVCLSGVSKSIFPMISRWQEGLPACKKLGVDALIVTIWQELCTCYSSSCHHHLVILSASNIQNGDILVPAYPSCLGKWPLSVVVALLICLCYSLCSGVLLACSWQCWLDDRKGIWPVTKLTMVMVVMIWLNLCTSWSSSYHHHQLHHLLLQLQHNS